MAGGLEWSARQAQIGHSVWVESRIDLDEAALVISRQIDNWKRVGIEIQPITWRDVGERWPYPLKTDRAEVIDPDSVGLALRKGEQEGELVLFKGGWADLRYWDGKSNQIIDEAPGWDDWMSLDDFERLLNRFAGLFA
jgi:hypothetical protein